METGSDWAQRPVRSQDLRCFNVERVPELPGSFLHCSVRWNNDSFTMPAHPDVGEGASPLPVRPGRAFLLRTHIACDPQRFKLQSATATTTCSARNELLMSDTLLHAKVASPCNRQRGDLIPPKRTYRVIHDESPQQSHSCRYRNACGKRRCSSGHVHRDRDAQSLNDQLASRIEAAGGTITARLPQIGVAIV